MKYEVAKICIQAGCAAAMFFAAPMLANSQTHTADTPNMTATGVNNADTGMNRTSGTANTNTGSMNTHDRVDPSRVDTPNTATPAMERSFDEGSESVGGYISDAMVTTAVKGRFMTQEGLSSMDIGVETNQGVVRLTGDVDDPAKIPLAEKTANEVDGVRGIINDIVYKR